MKNISKLLVLSIFALTVCVLTSYAVRIGGSAADLDGYLTEDEVKSMIQGIEENITVNGGDNYDITINSSENKNLIAASKALLSSVSIESNFNVVTTTFPSIFGPGSSYTSPQTYYGSGVIYQVDKENGDAYVITNYHVVYCKGADTEDDISDNIKIYLYGKEYSKYAISAEYVGGSPIYDIAVLKVKSSDVIRESKAMAASFADSNEIAILDTAIAIGNAEAYGISATIGAVSVESEQITIEIITGSPVKMRVLRFDAAVNSGNSGGGLFNDKGEIIGIVNAKSSDYTVENIGYAIPSNLAKNVVENIIYYDNIDPQNDGVYRALIGVNVAVEAADVNYDIETGKVLRVETVVVSSVSEGSVAEGKLQVDDVIKSVTIDGVEHEIVRSYNVVDVMITARKTSKVVFHIERDGVDMNVEVDMSSVELTKS